MSNETRERTWSFAEGTILRSTAFIHLLVMAFGWISPATLFAPWGLPIAEPATFFRFTMLAYGALGFALLRVLKLPRKQGALLVETVALVKLSLFSVIMVESILRKLPAHAPLLTTFDLVFGVALFRASRRG